MANVMLLLFLAAGLADKMNSTADLADKMNSTLPCPELRVASETSENETRIMMAIVAGSASRDLLVRNMRRVHEDIATTPFSVAWHVLLYSARTREDNWESAFAVAEELDVAFEVVEAARAANVTCPYCPKLLFQLQLAGDAPNFDFVWLLDADMSFQGFDWPKFWRRHALAGSPVVSQPLIRPNTQFVPFRNNEWGWRHCPDSPGVRTAFVEQQAMIVDAKFFAWVAEDFQYLAQIQQTIGNDWGLDIVLCGAARAYVSHVLEGGSWRTPCGFVFTTILHTNTHTIAKSNEFVKAGNFLFDEMVEEMYGRNNERLSKLKEEWRDLRPFGTVQLRHFIEEQWQLCAEVSVLQNHAICNGIKRKLRIQLSTDMRLAQDVALPLAF